MIPLEPGTQNLYAESNNPMQVGSLVIVKYSIRKKLLHYLGVIKDVNADDYLIQFLKHSGGGELQKRTNIWLPKTILLGILEGIVSVNTPG